MLLDSTLEGEAYAHPLAAVPGARVLVLGIGNVLMGDEGVGVHVLRQLEQEPCAAGVRLLDGGTGGVSLLTEFDGVQSIILIDATRDGRPAGTITYLHPDRVVDLPRGLGAHDFGLKDLFAAAALIGQRSQRLQRLAQGVGRVGIVHRHQRLSRAAHALHAPGHRAQRLTGVDDRGQRDTQRAHGGHHAQQVGDVIASDQLGLQHMARGIAALADDEAQALRFMADVARLQSCRADA